MKLKALCILTLAFVPCLTTAAGHATSTMASVLTELNHFPSAADKEALASIAEDASSTADEKLLAQIISRVAHRASSADKAELKKILEKETPEAISIIASAILNTNHQAQSEDLQALKTLID